MHSRADYEYTCSIFVQHNNVKADVPNNKKSQDPANKMRSIIYLKRLGETTALVNTNTSSRMA